MEENELVDAFNAGFDDDQADVAADQVPTDVETTQEPEVDAAKELSEYQKLELLFDERLKEASREIEARVEERYQKVTGKLGEFNRKLIEAQNTGKGFSISKDNLKYVAENFGEEFAEGLANDLQGLGGRSGDDETLKEYVKVIEDRHNDHVISMKHRNWKADVASPEFSEWFDGLSPEMQNDSDNPVDIIELLDTYKELKSVEGDETFQAWRQSVGDAAIPNDLIVSTYNGWKEINALEGFADWASKITDDATRYRIGRDSSKQFMDAAKQAFKDHQGLNSSKPKEQATQPTKQVNKRIEAAVLPPTTAEYAGQGTGLTDYFLSAFDE